MAVLAVAAMCLLWYAPIVFGVHRSLLALLGLVAAARLALAPLLTLRQMPPVRTSWWRMLVLLLGAFALVAGVLLSVKLHFLGWAFAID